MLLFFDDLAHANYAILHHQHDISNLSQVVQTLQAEYVASLCRGIFPAYQFKGLISMKL